MRKWLTNHPKICAFLLLEFALIIGTCLWAAVSPATIGALVIGNIAIPSVVLIVIFAIEAGKNLLEE